MQLPAWPERSINSRPSRRQSRLRHRLLPRCNRRLGCFRAARGTTAIVAERERALKPKDSFKECDTCPEMVVVPAGTLHDGLAGE